MVAAPKWSTAAPTTQTVLVGPTVLGSLRPFMDTPVISRTVASNVPFTATDIAGWGLDQGWAVQHA